MLWKLCSLSHYFSARFAKWEYLDSCWRMNRTAKKCAVDNKRDARFVSSLCRLIHSAIVEENEADAYRAIELLKKAFGEKMVFQDASGKVMQLCATALKQKQFATTGYLLDAYRPLLRNVDQRFIGIMLRELTLILDIAKRQHQEYIFDKAAKCIFEVCAISTLESHEEAADALKAVGLNAIKHGDRALFSKAAQQVVSLRTEIHGMGEKVMLPLFSVWLHQILKRGEEKALQIYCDMVLSLRKAGVLTSDFIQCIVAESENAAGMIGANYRMRGKRTFLLFLLAISRDSESSMRSAARSIGAMIKLTVALQGLQAGLSLFLPLLEAGMDCLKEELTFTKSLNTTRPKVLAALSREIILLLEIVSKQSGKTEFELLFSLREDWLSGYERTANRCLIDQFCQLLLRRMMMDRNSRRRRLCSDSKVFLKQPLFDLLQTKKLGLDLPI